MLAEKGLGLAFEELQTNLAQQEQALEIERLVAAPPFRHSPHQKKVSPAVSDNEGKSVSPPRRVKSSSVSKDHPTHENAVGERVTEERGSKSKEYEDTDVSASKEILFNTTIVSRLGRGWAEVGAMGGDGDDGTTEAAWLDRTGWWGLY